MRRIAWLLLLLLAFTIPWELSLDLGEPLGNASRIAGIMVLLAALPAVFQAGRVRAPCAFCWIALALYLWFACTCFWSIDTTASLIKMRGYFQEMMIVWLVWEFADTAADLLDLVRATVAGSWVLALLTLAAFHVPAAAAGQFRFAAYGQDPNDVARFLDLGLPLAALLVHCERRWPLRAMAFGYFPVGLVAVLLTASRGGFLGALVAVAGSLLLLAQGRERRLVAAALALPPFLAAFWLIVPSATLARLATIPQQLEGGDLNQRLNIWRAGWEAFARAPLFGSGVGTFVDAAKTASMDSAHNTALSILVGGGLCALFLAFLLAVMAARAALSTRGQPRLSLVTCLLVLATTSLAATVEENRATWLLFGTVLLAARLSEEDAPGLAASFCLAPPQPSSGPVSCLAVEQGS